MILSSSKKYESIDPLLDILKILPSIIIQTQKDGTILYHNPSAELLLGEAIRHPGLKLHEIDFSWEKERILDGLANCVTSDNPLKIDDIRYDKQGDHGFLGFTLYMQKEPDGQVSVIWFGADITQKKRLLSQLQQVQKMEAIGQLAAGVAHEINTPTQYISDNLHFLKDAVGDLSRLWDAIRDALEVSHFATPEFSNVDKIAKEIEVEYLLKEAPSAISQSLDGAEQIARIVGAMKEFAHPETDEKKPSDINRIVQNTITLSQNEWKWVAQIEKSFSPDLPLVPCIPGLLNQVFLNLIVNAAHAIKMRNDQTAQELTGKIGISTRAVDGWVIITVEDNGVGIPDAIKERIFEPFFTTKEVGEGTGQGLAIAHEAIVVKHDGLFHVRSTVGVGTTFYVELPMQIP